MFSSPPQFQAFLSNSFGGGGMGRGLLPEESPDTQTPSYPVATHHILPPIPGGADRAEVRVICDVAAHGGAPS